MTVGLTLSNGREAVAIADRRASDQRRQDDSAEKLGFFKSESYSGVLFGTGSGGYIKEMHAAIAAIPADILDSFVSQTHEAFRARVTVDDESFMRFHAGIAQTKAQFLPEAEREEYLRSQVREALTAFDRHHADITATHFVSTAYDKNHEKVRSHYISADGSSEIFQLHTEIGSGRDGAESRFIAKLPGVSLDAASLPDLAFLALNAYSGSQMNSGVGGSPAIAIIDAQGARLLSDEKTIALANLSGAHLSEGFESTLSNRGTRGYFAEILQSERPSYAKIAGQIGLKRDALTGLYVPSGSWQEMANKKLFPKRKQQ